MKPELDISVLIIEDDKMFRELAFQVFEGCNRIGANNAEEGFEKFKKFCPDITLLDIGLPDKSGLDLLPELIGHDPEAFIVMLTASSVIEDVKNAKEHGATGYIIKPFTYKKVDDCIAKYYEYKNKLNSLSPDERAENIVKELKTESIDEDILKHQQKIEQDKITQATIKAGLKELNILFVDDYPTNRLRASKQLRNLGCNVDIAGSGKEALELIHKNNYNIIFMDSHMPEMDGYQVTDMIREDEKHDNKERCIIVAMVEYTDEIEDKIWEKHDMDSYVKKPARFSQLRHLLEKYILNQKEKSGEKMEVTTEDIAAGREVIKSGIKINEKNIKKGLKNLRILFADDYPPNRFHIGNKLKNLGCKVDIAIDKKEILDLITDNVYDFIFMDLHMQGLENHDGYEATKLIRENEESSGKERQAIFGMVEYSDEVENKLWKKSGMDDFIKKPASFSIIKEILENYVIDNIIEQANG